MELSAFVIMLIVTFRACKIWDIYASTQGPVVPSTMKYIVY